MAVTFVSAFLNLGEERAADRSVAEHFRFFDMLQQTGVRIHLFLSPEFRGRVNLTNGVIEYISLEDLDTYAVSPQSIPVKRHEQHDTRRFLILMNSKTELVKRAISSRMHSSAHYAWIDFSICHIFRTIAPTLEQVKTIGNTAYPDTCLLFPGCWPTMSSNLSAVNWRFCGGFFLGDKASLLDLADRHIKVLPSLPTITWEVNVWALLETMGWTPTWYKADHDDSMVWIPYTTGIVRVPSKVPLYWSGGYSHCHVGSSMEQYVTQSILRHSKKVSAIFTQSDGIIDDAEFNRMIETLGREDKANSPASKIYTELEAAKRIGTESIICMLCSRGFDRSNMMLLPLDDHTFDVGLANVLAGVPKPTWETRKSLAFWRGASSGCERPTLRLRILDNLVSFPHADVRFTPGGWDFNDKAIPAEYFTDARASIETHVEFKYILIVDGNCIASAHQWVFGSGSVPIMITHPDNNWWFKKFLKPMVNYVPIKYDLSDLQEKIQWLVDHDAEAKQIADNAMLFANTVFTPEFQRAYVDTEINRILTGDGSMLRSRYEAKCRIPCDINEHLPTLLKYAKKCDSVTECGVCNIVSSYAFATGLLGNPNGVFKMVDPYRSHNIDMFTDMCEREGIKVKYFQDSDLTCPCEETDLLFIDTWHVYAQLKRELEHWHSFAKKYIVMHDTTVDEWYGESVRGNFDIMKQSRDSGFPPEEIARGLWPAITEFLSVHPEWKLEERFTNNNGLTVLSRCSDTVS